MTNEQLIKYSPWLGVPALAMLACGLAGYIIAQWPVIETALKPAII
jgi:hypothetical protein